MAGTISMLTGAAAEVLSSPIGSSPIRSGPQRSENRSAPPESSLPNPPVVGVEEQPVQDQKYLASLLERARNAGLASTTTLTFERDNLDGNMYVSIKDKRTGEEVIRIPRKYLENAAPPQGPGHRVNVRI
jgi:uncharacterized FlaG/YvyC family protein